MTLKERRTQWEKGLIPLLVLPLREGMKDHASFDTVVFVILKSKTSYFLSLNRYFQVGGSWQVSVDVAAEQDIEVIYNHINDSFSTYIPEEGEVVPEDIDTGFKCIHCGSGLFFAHQVCRLDIIVNINNNWQDNQDEGKDTSQAIYDAETPHGPYTCQGCGAEFDELKDPNE